MATFSLFSQFLEKQEDLGSVAGFVSCVVYTLDLTLFFFGPKVELSWAQLRPEHKHHVKQQGNGNNKAHMTGFGETLILQDDR